MKYTYNFMSHNSFFPLDHPYKKNADETALFKIYAEFMLEKTVVIKTLFTKSNQHLKSTLYSLF